MAWDEAKTWLSGSAQGKHYQSLLEDATDMPRRNAQRRKVVFEIGHGQRALENESSRAAVVPCGTIGRR